MLWSAEADELLIRLWDEGGSLSYVANGMTQAGYVVSRNSVSGRRHRLPRECFKRDLSAHAIDRIAPRARKTNKPKKTRPMTERKPVIDLSTHEGIDYLDLQPWQCKAIIDGPRAGPWLLHKVCGLPRLHGLPYCRGHNRLYTSPASVRKPHGEIRKVS